jgi:hypothetical protein
MGILEHIASEKEPGQTIYAEHKLAKKRFIARYLWEPTLEIRLQLRQRFSRNGQF